MDYEEKKWKLSLKRMPYEHQVHIAKHLPISISIVGILKTVVVTIQRYFASTRVQTRDLLLQSKVLYARQ